MYSISPSYVPAVVQVPDGKIKVQVPALGADIVAVIVASTVVVPSSLILSFTVPPVKSIAAQVVLSSGSRILPEAAVLLSFKLNVSSGVAKRGTCQVSDIHNYTGDFSPIPKLFCKICLNDV